MLRPEHIKIKRLVSVPRILSGCGMKMDECNVAIEITPYKESYYDRFDCGFHYVLLGVHGAGFSYRQTNNVMILQEPVVNAIELWLAQPFYAGLSLSEFLVQAARGTHE